MGVHKLQATKAGRTRPHHHRQGPNHHARAAPIAVSEPIHNRGRKTSWKPWEKPTCISPKSDSHHHISPKSDSHQHCIFASPQPRITIHSHRGLSDWSTAIVKSAVSRSGELLGFFSKRVMRVLWLRKGRVLASYPCKILRTPKVILFYFVKSN